MRGNPPRISSHGFCCSVPSSSLPGLFSLYHRDAVIKFSLNALGFGLLVAGGIQWASQPVPGAPNNDSMPFGVPEADFISMIGLGLSVVGALVLVWRFCGCGGSWAKAP